MSVAGVVDTQPVRVFTLDDHELVRAGIRALLSTRDDVVLVGEAANAADALTQIAELQPDVALLDIMLGGGNGIDVCRQIRARHPEVRCIMLTSIAEDEAMQSAVLAGAAGYMLKQVSAAELAKAVTLVAAGKSLLDPRVTEGALERVRADAKCRDDLARLSDQERRILELIGEGCTNRQIGEALFLAEKTVKNYVTSILSKLGMQRRTEVAAFAARLGERHGSSSS
ncbi:MAG: response regulator transcription factor [Acidimicrobiia bacterium]|nr:response regulator transcription factor [Acidimicrobiia bacterium]